MYELVMRTILIVEAWWEKMKKFCKPFYEKSKEKKDWCRINELTMMGKNNAIEGTEVVGNDERSLGTWDWNINRKRAKRINREDK